MRYAWKAPLSVTVLLALLTSCGGGDAYDSSGYMHGEDDQALFARGSQQYFRGALTASRETFESLEGSFPDSPLRDDAALAIRRIDSDFSGEADTASMEEVQPSAGLPPLAIVGTSIVLDRMERLVSMLAAEGCSPEMVVDPGAPELTLVLYSEGHLAGAQLLADTLDSWLTAPASVTVQPGGNIIPAVAPGHEGVVLIVGADAALAPASQVSPQG